MKTTKQKIYRIIAVYLLLNTLAELFAPVAAYALTNGPGQPEFQSFESAGATEMVNLFTGDFSYNIPLMTVPGPNGGYPINLAYSAGAGVDQEASWVGLGWNINAGAINRSMRGLPDDFKGDDVIKEMTFQPSTSVTFSLGRSLGSINIKREFLGFNLFSYGAGVQVYYNNYRGVGFRFAGNFALSASEDNGAPEAPPLRLNLTSSSDGIGVNLSYPVSEKTADANEKSRGIFTGSLGWSSREGLTDMSLGISKGKSIFNGWLTTGVGAGVCFASSGYTPISSPEVEGFMADVSLSIGTDTNFKWSAKKATSVIAAYNQTWLKYNHESHNAYGYLYNEYSGAIYDEHVLEDVNRDKNVPPTRQTKSLGVPIATYDAYSVSGQGMGGVFRPYRSDMGIYTIPRVTSTIYGGSVGVEWGAPAVGTSWTKWGVDGSYKQSQTYSGMWHNHFWVGTGNQGWNDIDDFVFQGSDGSGAYSGDYLYEPFYFKMSGEQTATPTDQTDFIGGSSTPVRLHLEEPFEDGNNFCPRPEIASSDLSNGSSSYPLSASDNHRAVREKTVTRNVYRTQDEMEYFSASVPANIFSMPVSYPASGGAGTPVAYDYTSRPGHHIAEFTETGVDGNRYVYGIPVYALSTKEVLFASADFSEYPTDYIATYNSTQASLGNAESGTDRLYASTELPGYASTYLLTQVLSPDYVDVTGDGPSYDDLGHYTLFNYVKVNSAYEWRAPYTGAILNAAHLSDTKDDKMSYTYGTKECYLMHSIETKTHIACFYLEETSRKDGHAAEGEFSPSMTASDVNSADESWALDHISLYSKADPDYGTAQANPLTSVYFDYNYDLCPSTLNNENNDPSVLGQEASSGKLTLEGIYFTYRQNQKGKLSPYAFDYVDATYQSDLQNPEYDPLGNDRWGTYKKQSSTSNFQNNENPYVDQMDRQRADQSAAAWCLKTITLPSGGVINVEYEADDYAYVQNKKAMQMCRVIGFGEEGVSNPALATDVDDKLKKKRTRVYFELIEPIADGLSDPQKEAEVYKYIDGIDEMYFKLFLSLKEPYSNPTGADLEDYVDGFCRIKNDAGSYGVVDDNGSADEQYGFLTVELVDRDDYPNIVSPTQVHPFEKAAWQYMYLERPDLFVNPNVASGAFANLVGAITAIITDLPRAVAPYITANVKGWGNKIDINTSTWQHDNRPSFIRLNVEDGKKVGGGHRVKQITVSDDWADLSGSVGTQSSYGQSYVYQLTDGSSSGVASYEPLIGGEENPLYMPLRYNSDNLVKKDGAFYVPLPLCESHYPSPVVGYSRVIVSSVVDDNSQITKSRTGKTAYEFYTAKDYPVFEDHTDLQKTWFPIPVTIPFVGSISYNMRGFSQGYVVELNDMHGKLKAVATYPSYADVANSPSIPTRRVFYEYNGGYEEGKANRLNSEVDVLTSDGVYGTAKLGETYDFFFDMGQHSNESQELGLQFNMEVNGLTGAVVPTFMPAINISKSLYRSVVAMKVIHRTGILMAVETTEDGAKSTARNLMFDSETGSPLLSEVQNEFERPVYTYNFAAHWPYEGMEGAYQNQGTRFVGESTNGSGILNVSNAENYFLEGDEVMFIPSSPPGTMLWVSSVNASTDNVTLIDEDGNAAASLSGTFIIHRSGHRNQQSVANGVIVSLSNPVTERNFPLFEAFNSYAGPVTGSPQEIQDFFTDCATGVTHDVTFNWSTNTLGIVIVGECEATVVFPAGHGIDDLAEAFTWDLHYAGGTVTATNGGTTLNCGWTDWPGCYKACMDDVLHASAVRFTENWSASTPGHGQEINFADVDLSVSSTNDYKFGLRGVWRTHSTYLYQVERKQTLASASKTDISKDGTYDNFAIYDWLVAPQDNTNWSFVSEITRYSPYGFALETRDALGIYSTSMFGYENTKQVSAASNCQYFEMAFDGFEDYTSGYSGHGHMLFTDVNGTYPSALSATYAHTGSKSLRTQYNGDSEFSVVCNGAYTSSQQYFEAQPGQEYFLSVWVRADGGGTPEVEIDNGTSVSSFTPDLSKSPVEGWRKIDASFTAPTSGNTLTIKLRCLTSGYAYFDDLRIQPFKSAMVSYVYDPQTHWMLAELDSRNYATFYNYDEEGSLTQAKQETERGIFTVQTSRSNIKK